MKKYTAMIASLVLVGASAAMAGDEIYPQSSTAALHPDVIEGKDVVDISGEQLGDVDEVVKDRDNRHLAVIGLEDSRKEVAIPIDRLSLSTDGEFLVTRMTRDELEALPDYDPMDMESVEE